MTENLNLSYLTFQEIAKALLMLTEEQFQSIAEGRARIEISFDNKPVVLTPIRTTGTGAGGSKRTGKVTIEEAAQAIKMMTRSEDVLAYLKTHDRALTMDNLRELAILLGPTVSLTGGRKAQLWADIANGTTGYKEQSAVMLPGGFR